jgi:hypothetical protein
MLRVAAGAGPAIRTTHRTMTVPPEPLPTVERPPRWFDPTLDDLEAVLRLPPNWNSYRARPVEAQAAVAAIELLLAIMPDSLSKPTIIPTVRGSVQLEWHTRGVDLEIDVLANGRYALFFEDDQTGVSWEREASEAAGLTRPVLAELARRMASTGQWGSMRGGAEDDRPDDSAIPRRTR